jgi:hypothetical protein
MAVEEKYIVQDLSWLFCCLSLWLYNAV